MNVKYTHYLKFRIDKSARPEMRRPKDLPERSGATTSATAGAAGETDVTAEGGAGGASNTDGGTSPGAGGADDSNGAAGAPSVSCAPGGTLFGTGNYQDAQGRALWLRRSATATTLALLPSGAPDSQHP